MHQYEDLITIFHDCFFEKYNTQLIKGSDEPLYLPADAENPHNRLFFAHGFYASALHECAHWLIAGEERRKLIDFGYWYVPDGRSPLEQQLFQSAEIKPQAMEWILSTAAKFPFRVSIDNLNGPESETTSFKHSVYEQVKTYCAKGLSVRAEIFRTALCHFYHSPLSLRIEEFNLDVLYRS
ncbi:MAG TPA: elongation factor P hydroxylase [Chlamydiales bacterium]|jgi:elongation factor P hydroxylase|nr:elongation factor P hydroxylase [Chlamydiales bacterium]